MKGSREIIWELGAVLKSKGNLPIWGIAVCGYKNNSDVKFICHNKDGVGEFLGKLMNASLSKFIREIEINYWITGHLCSLDVWVEDSEDGTTNIDADVIEAFSKLKWWEWRWGTTSPN